MGGTVLVTGGTGFLGRHVVRALRRAGRGVRLLQRNADRALLDELAAEGLGGDEVTVELGSVLDARVVARAMDACDAVAHLAGRVSRDRRDRRALRELHVEGTRTLVRAAAEAGVRRVVYLSTSGTIACSRDASEVATEETSYPWDVIGGWPYYETKVEAEQVALETARARGMELVCLNPSLFLGPGDVRGSSTEDVVRILQRKVPAIPSGAINFVDVRDVADAAVAALSQGRPGERYLLGAANWSLRTFFRRVGELGAVRVPTLRAPDALTRWAAYGVDPLLRLMGMKSPLDPVSVEMSQVYWYFDSAKAEAELGFSPRPPDDTLRDTIEDLRARGVA